MYSWFLELGRKDLFHTSGLGLRVQDSRVLHLLALWSDGLLARKIACYARLSIAKTNPGNWGRVFPARWIELLGSKQFVMPSSVHDFSMSACFGLKNGLD